MRLSALPALTLALAATGIVSQSAQAAILFIDTFDTPQSVVQVQGAPSGSRTSSPSTVSTLGGDILGGQRRVVVTRLTPPNNTLGSVGTDVGQSLPSAASFLSGPSTRGRATYTYNGGGSLLADLTLGGSVNRLAFLAFSDLGAQVTLEVRSSGNRASRSSVTLPADPTQTFVPFTLLYSSFAAFGAGGAADFSNVNSINLIIDGSGHPGSDVALDFFIAGEIPEPGTVVTLGAGLVTLAIYARRRRK